jgi:single-strand DNA-binding protein
MSNTMTIIGNLTNDPELRFTQAGKPMLTGSIASNRRYQVNGEWKEEPSYFNYVIWGDLADNAAASLRKGSRVLATGRLQQREWQDKDGNKRISYDLVIDEIAPSLKWATVTITKTAKSAESSPTASYTADAPTPSYTEEEPF